MNIIFFGSDDFALKSLEALCASEHKVAACVTQPDKPKGRGLKENVSVIKEFALRRKIPVLQPAHLRDDDLLEKLAGYAADLFVVIAYGRILPAEVLSLPKVFAVNVHGSLLPKYRGAAPINWAIINGETQTGVSIIKLNDVMDAGEVITQSVLPIAPEDTALTLRSKMAQQGAQLLLQTIRSIEQNHFRLAKQDLSQVTYAPKLTKELGAIRWSDKAQSIHNLVRGLLPWPAAFSYADGKRFKILETAVVNALSGTFKPGEVAQINADGIVVATGQKALCLKRVQPDAGKPMDARSFAAGQRLKVKSQLG